MAGASEIREMEDPRDDSVGDNERRHEVDPIGTMNSPADSDMREGTPINELRAMKDGAEITTDASTTANGTRDVSTTTDMDEDPATGQDNEMKMGGDDNDPEDDAQKAASTMMEAVNDEMISQDTDEKHEEETDMQEEEDPSPDDVDSEESEEDDNYGPDPKDRIQITSGIPLSTPNDSSSLSPLLTFIRSTCVEYFTVQFEENGDDNNDGSPIRKGRSRFQIVEGTVGIRCVFCKDLSEEKRGRQSMAFPTGLDKICSAVGMWQCRHAPICKSIPQSIRQHLGKLKQQGPGERGNSNVKTYWVDSAKEKGLMDTRNGIMFVSQEAMEKALEGGDVCREIGGSLLSLDGGDDTTGEVVTKTRKKKREGLYTDVETPRRSSGRWSVRKGRGKSKQDGNDNDDNDQGDDNGGSSGGRGRTKRTPAKYDNESDAEEENEEVGGSDTWECDHCGTEHSLDKKRCGKCKHFRKGCGPRGGRKSQTPRSLSPEVKSRSASRGRRSASATPVQIRGKRGQVEDNAEDTWKCCGEVYSPERKRCSSCHCWRDGSQSGSKNVSPAKRSKRSPAVVIDEQYGELPPGIEIGIPKKYHCKVLDCNKHEQRGKDGFCCSHYNLIVRDRESTPQKLSSGTHWTCECGLQIELAKSRCKCYKWRGGMRGGTAEDDVMDEEELVPQDDRPKHKTPKCKIPGCDKFKQTNCDDMCYRHHRQSTAKYDSVEEAKKKTPSPRKAMRGSSPKLVGRGKNSSLSDDTNVSRSRSGRAVNPSPKVRYRDDDSDFRPEILPSKSSGTKRARDEEEKSNGTKGKKAKDSVLCMHEGCTRYRQSGCSGYCCTHSPTISEYRNVRMERKNGIKNNANHSSDASLQEQEKVEVVTSTNSPAKKKAKVSEDDASQKSPAKKKSVPQSAPIFKSPDSGKSVFSTSKLVKTDNSGIKMGDMVKIDPSGALARVVKVNLDDSNENVTYDLMKIFGGREHAVEGGRISVYRTGSVFSPQPSPILRRDAPQFKNTTAMLEMTRYNLLSGQDCWICLSCSIIVPSLTMTCGVCNKHPTFVPLEMNEFKEFVRGQRKKQNRLWLRKEMPDTRSKVTKHLCKFQGCVQPSQISHNGYCETHNNAGVLVRRKDFDEFSEFFCFLYKQMEPIVLTEDDLSNPQCKDRDIGDPGIACKHCNGRRSFPRGVEALRQKTLTMSLFRHMTECKQCPHETKVRLKVLQAKGKPEKDDAKAKTGSNRAFLVRIWNRLQRLSSPEFRVCRLQGCKEIAKHHCDGLCDLHRTATRLVLPHDHSIIQDFASLVFEQMQPCNLVESDKVDGLHLGMENGAPGLECRHCIGLPNHLRFFPSNEAHLNEIGAVGLFSTHIRDCANCPERIKTKLAALAPESEHLDGLKTYYGRVWTRIQQQQQK